MAQQLAGLAGLLQNIQVSAGIQPQIVSLPSPPRLEGSLAPNSWLTKVQKHANNHVLGPESMVLYKGYVYTGQADGWVVEISPYGRVRKLIHLSVDSCRRRKMEEGACGRPMGIRLNSRGYLFVADAYHGIFQINPRSGRFKQLVNSRQLRVNGKALRYINDLAVASDGTIFFTSSSSKWTLLKENNIIFEGDNTGRVLFYNPRERMPNKQVQELVTGLSFPNGLQLSPDESFLLVAEGARSRILRVWVGQITPVRSRIEVFARNLPGVVDNIRLSPRGTYWVGISQVRHSGLPSVLDTYGSHLRIRAALITLVNKNIKFDNPKFGMAVELSADGRVLRSLQDPEGSLYTGISEVQEYKGVLFLASPGKRFIGYIKLDSLLPPDQNLDSLLPPDQNDTQPANTVRPGVSQSDKVPVTVAPTPVRPATPATQGTQPVIQNPKVTSFLNQIENNMGRMSLQRVKQVVLDLVKQLILAKHEAVYLRRLALARKEEARRLRIALSQLRANMSLETQQGGDQDDGYGAGVGGSPLDTGRPGGTGMTESSATASGTGGNTITTQTSMSTSTGSGPSSGQSGTTASVTDLSGTAPVQSTTTSTSTSGSVQLTGITVTATSSPGPIDQTTTPSTSGTTSTSVPATTAGPSTTTAQSNQNPTTIVAQTSTMAPVTTADNFFPSFE